MNEDKTVEKILYSEEEASPTNAEIPQNPEHELDSHGIKGAVSLYVATSLIHLS